MPSRPVLLFPHPHLRKKSMPVQLFDDKLQQLIDDMFETMYKEKGGGLAAIQIDVPLQVVVIDPLGDHQTQYVLINPEIVEQHGETESTEGCLSVPEVTAAVTRYEYVKVKALNRFKEEFILEASKDYLASCLQHEIDHLQGKLFIDYLSPLKQQRIQTKLVKMQREKK